MGLNVDHWAARSLPRLLSVQGDKLISQRILRSLISCCVTWRTVGHPKDINDCRIHLINPLLKRKKSSLESVETLQLRLHLRPVSTYFSVIVISEETPPWPPPGGRLCSMQEIDPSIAVLINASRQRGLGKTCYFLIFFFSREFSLPSAAAELISFSNYQKSRPLYCFGRLRSLSCRLVAATSVILLLLGCPPSTQPLRLRF